MRQRIWHGGDIDAATPSEVASIIAAAQEERSVPYTRRKGVAQLDASGNCNHRVGVVPSQYDWLCERITLSAGSGALVQIFENDSNSLSELLEVIGFGTTGLYSDSFANNLYVPANSTLIIVCTGGPANGQLTYNIQIHQVRRPQ